MGWCVMARTRAAIVTTTPPEKFSDARVETWISSAEVEALRAAWYRPVDPVHPWAKRVEIGVVFPQGRDADYSFPFDDLLELWADYRRENAFLQWRRDVGREVAEPWRASLPPIDPRYLRYRIL